VSYLALKHIHMTCVALSGLGFLLRGYWMAMASPWLYRRWVRVLPHINDSLLLASAITLAVWSGQYPLAQAWLTAKVGGLLAYILFGMMALRRGRTRRQRLVFFILGVTAFAYIVGVALTRSPWSYAAW